MINLHQAQQVKCVKRDEVVEAKHLHVVDSDEEIDMENVLEILEDTSSSPPNRVLGSGKVS